jgi:hypothetical protein
MRDPPIELHYTLWDLMAVIDAQMNDPTLASWHVVDTCWDLERPHEGLILQDLAQAENSWERLNVSNLAK